MNRFLTSLIAVCACYSVPLYSQNYLNIRYTDGSDKNVPFASLQKITFDETAGNVNIRLTDATTQAVAFTALQKMTSADAGAGAVLPVELVTFIATVNKNTVALSWTTATEVNNYGFDIERRAQSVEWGKIGFVQGNGTSNSQKEYSFTDAPQEGTKFQYRLKQIDNDHKFSYSEIVTIDIGTPAVYELKQNFPNPFNPQTTITYKLSTEGFVSIKIFDIVGREVASLVNENKKAGSYEITFDGSRLSSGIYFCKMSSETYSSITKMIIMK